MKLKWLLNIIILVAVLIAMAGMLELITDEVVGQGREEVCITPENEHTYWMWIHELNTEEKCNNPPHETIVKLLDDATKDAKATCADELAFECPQHPKCAARGGICSGYLADWSLNWDFTWVGDACKYTATYHCLCYCKTGVPCVPFSNSDFPVHAVSTIGIALAVAVVAIILRKRIITREY